MQFTQGLHRAVQQKPNALATVFGQRRRSFAQLKERVARLAGAFRALGISQGERVAILALNSDHYLEFYLACAWIGAVVNPVNYRWSTAEITYSLRDSEACLLVLDEHFAAQREAIVAQSPRLRHCLLWSAAAEPSGPQDLEHRLLASAPIADEDIGGDRLFGIFYTGGTTGAPKGVMLSHANICSSALALLAEGCFAEGCIGLHAAPMFHLADMMVSACVLLRGGRHIMLSAFRPDATLQLIAQEKISDLLLVPAMLQALVDAPMLAQHDISSVRRVLYGAAPVSEALLDRAMQALPGADFTQVYGMTEMSAVMTALPPVAHRPEARALGKLRSAGRVSYHVQLRIVGEQDVELTLGQVGEISVRGPNIMQGYYGKPEASEAALRKGWMHTGDMGYLDADGYLFIVDRLKDMIISGGENVYSVEVENAISAHPAVAACAVFGIPNAEWGEIVHAAVVLRQGASLAYDELYGHCKALIAGYKCPRSLQLLDSLPLSGAGKVLKSELRKPYWEGRERAIN